MLHYQQLFLTQDCTLEIGKTQASEHSAKVSRLQHTVHRLHCCTHGKTIAASSLVLRIIHALQQQQQQRWCVQAARGPASHLHAVLIGPGQLGDDDGRTRGALQARLDE